MKPYAFDPKKKNNTGCCPGHDWPRTRRWSGRYSSANSKKTDRRDYTMAKRSRRRTDKQALRNEG